MNTKQNTHDVRASKSQNALSSPSPLSPATALIQNLRAFRKLHRLSQEEFATLCGLHRTYIGSIENGKRNVSLKTLEIIGKAMNVSLIQLLDPMLLGNNAVRSRKNRTPKAPPPPK